MARTRSALWLVPLCVVVLSSLVLAACKGAATPTPAPKPAATPAATPAPAVKPIEMRYTMYLVKEFPSTIVDIWWADQVMARTGGKVKITTYPGGTLGGPTDMLPLVRSGAVELAQPAPAYWPAEFPLFGAMNTIFPFASPKEVLTVANRLDSGAVPEVAAIFEKETKAQNFKSLYWSSADSDYYITTKKPVKSLADLKGMKVRTLGVYQPELVKRLGMTPVTVMPAEWYDALSKGVVDAMLMALYSQAPYKIYEVANQISFGTGLIGFVPIVINLDVWNKLPPDVQKVMTDLRWETAKYEEEVLTRLYNETKPKYVFNEVPKAEQELIFKTWNEIQDTVWLEDMKKKGFGKEAETFLKALRAEIAQVRGK